MVQLSGGMFRPVRPAHIISVLSEGGLGALVAERMPV